MSEKFRFRREVFRFDEDGLTETFDWSHDGWSWFACARGLYDGNTPCVEAIWYERVEDE